MSTLTSIGARLREHPTLRLGLSLVVAAGFTLMPLQAMTAGSANPEHAEGWGEPCISGCDERKQLCCNDPIG